MPAAVASSARNTGGAAATATCTYSATAANQLEAFIRGSANASATIALIYDNSGTFASSTGSPSTTVIPVASVSWTTNQWAGRAFVITSSGVSANVNQLRIIASNDANTVTLATPLPATPASGDTLAIGNVWAIADSGHGNAWTPDGGVATSHAQWWEATNCIAASASTLTVVWGGGNTGFTIDVHEISGAGGVAQTTTAASGNSGTPISNSITASQAGLLLGGFSNPTTAQNWSTVGPTDNSGGSAMTIDTPSPSSTTYRMCVASRHESSGTYAPRASMPTSEGWVATPLFIPDTGGAAQDTPELYGRPYGRSGQRQLHQLLAQ